MTVAHWRRGPAQLWAIRVRRQCPDGFIYDLMYIHERDDATGGLDAERREIVTMTCVGSCPRGA